MKTGKPWTSQPIRKVSGGQCFSSGLMTSGQKSSFLRRAAAGILAASMILPFTACKKKSTSENAGGQYTSGQEILATDPYFDAEIHEVKLPIDPEKDLIYARVESCEYIGGCAIAQYSIEYEIPKEKEIEPMSYEEGLEYYYSATGLFDEKGNFIRNLGGLDLSAVAYAVDKDNNIYILCNTFDEETWERKTEIQVINTQGEKLKSIVTKDLPFNTDDYVSVDMHVMDDGRITMTTSGKLLVYDTDGNRVLEIVDPGRTITGGVITQDGKNYVVSGIYEILGDVDIQI